MLKLPNKCLRHPCHFSVWLSSRVVFLWGVITASVRHLLVPGHLVKWWEAICCLRRKKNIFTASEVWRCGVKTGKKKLDKGQKGRTKIQRSGQPESAVCQEVDCECEPLASGQRRSCQITSMTSSIKCVCWECLCGVTVYCHKSTHPNWRLGGQVTLSNISSKVEETFTICLTEGGRGIELESLHLMTSSQQMPQRWCLKVQIEN